MTTQENRLAEGRRNLNRRTRKAGRILCDYSPGETARTGLVDLLADSLHIFGEEQVRFALDTALAHYNAETGGEE
jgi:hypothetical protein